MPVLLYWSHTFTLKSLTLKKFDTDSKIVIVSSKFWEQGVRGGRGKGRQKGQVRQGAEETLSSGEQGSRERQGEVREDRGFVGGHGGMGIYYLSYTKICAFFPKF